MINCQQSIIILGTSIMIIAIYLRFLIMEQENKLQQNKQLDNTNQTTNQTINQTNNSEQNTFNSSHAHTHNTHHLNHIHTDNIKQRRLENRLLAPERSYESSHTPHIHVSHIHHSQPHSHSVPINIHTRGTPSKYQQVGVLVNNDATDPLIFPLYGRPIYPGSNKWNYYTSTNHYHSMKVPIEKDARDCLTQIGCNELYNDDTINIPVYGDSKEFKATIYQMDAPKYIPYIV